MLRCMYINLYKEIYKLVKQIPEGMITTYKDIADALGDTRTCVARVVAKVLHENPDLENIPCYRVVHSNGDIGGYKLGIEEKIRRLKKDGIKIKYGKIANFNKVRFNNFKSRKILQILRKEQEKLRKKLILEDICVYKKVAGVDVSYKNTHCIAVCVMENEIAITKEKTKFPYIPGYLYYRESRAMIKVIKKICADVYLIDGNGILHPCCLGIASHIGVLLNIPTIGIAKKLLLGEIKGNKIFVHNEQRGWMIKREHFTPLYVSPGHFISMQTCKKIVLSCSTTYRLPDVLHKAHVIAKKTKI